MLIYDVWEFIWICLAIWTYKDVKSREAKHKWLWSIGTLLFGIIVFLPYMLFGRKKNK
jgi:hypothetical protein